MRIKGTLAPSLEASSLLSAIATSSKSFLSSTQNAMAAERAEDDNPLMDDDDDDGMPPLVDNPYPSMTFTFAANMTPITYSTDQHSFELTPAATAPGTFMYEPPPDLVVAEPTKTSHAKKKDESYIPRPPNAFILFRSSFIKAQHIPEKIEGNHSHLSKIIGKYWKALPREEREVWEAKAIVALAEHRKKYPDWRFRPGANALAKVKDGPRRRNNKKGKGEAEKKVRNKEKRCDKIADLLVAGKKGVDLEAAIQAYDSESVKAAKVEECNNGLAVIVVQVQAEQKPSPARKARKTQPQPVQPQPTAPVSKPLDPAQPQRQHEDQQHNEVDISSDARFNTPLTSMFKRSSSAPAAYTRIGTEDQPDASHFLAARRHSICSLSSSTNNSRDTTASPPVFAHEARPRAVYGVNAPGNVQATRDEAVHQLSPLQPPLLSFASPTTNAAEHDSLALRSSYYWMASAAGPFEPDLCSPTLPAFVPDIDDGASPIASPLTSAYDIASDADYASPAMHYLNPHPQQYVQPYSSYSSLNGWAGDSALLAKCPPDAGVAYGLGSPYVVTPQSPALYDPDRVMKDAFEAASFASFDGFAPTNAGWANVDDAMCLQHYEQGLEDIDRRWHGDQRQLFNYSPVSAY
ncbi:hypothetical protein BDW22DRAFT_1423288 [Trametopsis cervina]|nr:hypothetical protein BDW22DRAFT_1423288 [Trametopsis cervina]